MTDCQKSYYEKRGQILVKNLRSRHFDAYYCETKEAALAKALELIPKEETVCWGGSVTAAQIGLFDALRSGGYPVIDREQAKTPEERTRMMKQGLLAHTFLTGANALSLDGQMVNIDGTGNRVGPIVYGPELVLVIAGMNKVEDSLEAAVARARTVAAPMNAQRFSLSTPCKTTAACADCKCPDSICNQILITRHCRPAGRIKFLLIGEDLGF